MLPNFDDEADAGGVGPFGRTGVAVEVDGRLGTCLLAAPSGGVGPGGGVAPGGNVELGNVLLSGGCVALDGGIWAGADCACDGATTGCRDFIAAGGGGGFGARAAFVATEGGRDGARRAAAPAPATPAAISPPAPIEGDTDAGPAPCDDKAACGGAMV